MVLVIFSSMQNNVHASLVALNSANPRELGFRHDITLEELEELDLALAEISQETHDSGFKQSYRYSEFKQSCRSLELDDCNVTSDKFKQAYIYAIANKKIDKSLLKLPWHRYVQTEKVINLYNDIDRAQLYFINFFTQQSKLVKKLRCINEQRVHGREISREDEIVLSQTLRTVPPEALALIEDDLFNTLTPDNIRWLTIDQLCMLSKKKIESITGDLSKRASLSDYQFQVLQSNPHYSGSKISAPVLTMLQLEVIKFFES